MENDNHKMGENHPDHNESERSEMGHNAQPNPNDFNNPGDLIFTHEIEALLNETIPTAPQEDISINDADLREIEEWCETESRTVDSLKQECHALLKQCHEKKQEIRKFKALPFSADCKNDMEIIYQNIEKEVHEDISNCSTQIRQNIRSSKSTAQLYLRKLKENTSLLSLQFEYIDITEAFSITCSEWNKRDKKLNEVKTRIQDFPSIREGMRQQVLREMEKQRKLAEIREIIHPEPFSTV